MSARGGGLLLAFLLAGACAGAAPGPVAAQLRPEPWRVPTADTLRSWATQANALLVAGAADTLTPASRQAFGLLNQVVRNQFERLGSRHMNGAAGVMALLDSLNVEAEFAQDPDLPQFCAVTFFNPKFAGYAALTYLYWWRGEELMHQGVVLRGGRHLRLRVWWTGLDLAPYELGMVDDLRTGEARRGNFTLLRLSRNADFWGIVQYDRNSIDLGGAGPADFVDLNHDGIPELVAVIPSAPDPRFVVDRNLPPILSHRVWYRTVPGFVPLERQTLATPFATFVLFLRALEAGEPAAVRGLAATPAVAARAQALRLGTFKAPGSWRVEEPPDGDRWDERLNLSYGVPPTLDHRLEVSMEFRDGRWVVGKLVVPVAPAGAGAQPPPGATPRRGGTRSTR
jgi:hypothetical protein